MAKFISQSKAQSHTTKREQANQLLPKLLKSMAPTLGANSSRHSIPLYKPTAAAAASNSSSNYLFFTTHHPSELYTIDKHKSPGMVVPLGPGKFYGSGLPRPRIYTDTKLNPERVDPPVSVMDSFLSWANEAHWSMGGLSFTRIRLQGRIEGTVTKLRKERDKFLKTQNKQSPLSPTPAPLAVKRRRFLALGDEEEVIKKKSYKRKLVNDFDRVANDDGLVGKRSRSKLLKGGDEIKNASPEKTKKAKNQKTEIRTSPRLAKR